VALDYFIQGFNWAIFSVHDLPAAKVTAIRIELWEIAWYYSLLALIYIVLTTRMKKLIGPLLAVLILGVLVNWVSLIEIRNKNEIYLYTATAGRAVDHIYGNTIFTWNEGWADQDIDYKITPNRIGQGIHSKVLPLHYEQGQNLLFLPEQKIITTKGKVQFIDFTPKEVAWFDGKTWRTTDPDSIKWQDNKAYRIKLE